MSSLPHEVLTIVFNELHLNKDKLQCQLTCKQWYNASTTRLYSIVIINSKKRAILYRRTISNSPTLGKLLNFIFFQDFESEEEKLFLLEAVILHCPNVTKIESYNYESLFWVPLMYAASQGRLSNLRTLPIPNAQNLVSYIYVALMFKNSLNILSLNDEGGYFRPVLANVAIYQTLCDQIDQFKKLQTVIISFTSDKYLCYFDELIDKCPHLKYLTFNVTLKDKLKCDKLKSKIRARPDIYSFRCGWRLMMTENQLKYVMCKFTHLMSLIVDYQPYVTGDNTSHCSSATLIKFIQYALSIPHFKIKFDVNKEEVMNIYDEFMKAKNRCKNVTLGFIKQQTLDVLQYNISLCASEGFGLISPLDTTNNEPPYVRFLSMVGKDIHALKINGPSWIRHINNPMADYATEWLFDIFKLCPLLEEFTLSEPAYFLPRYHELKYPSLKKLVIDGSTYTESDNFLSRISLNLPNLCRLYLSFSHLRTNGKEPIQVYMPHTSLDLLTWSEKSYEIEFFKSANVFIKLETDTGLKYYSTNKNILFPTSSKLYGGAVTHLRFDIKCKHLKELRIRRKNATQFDSNLLF